MLIAATDGAARSTILSDSWASSSVRADCGGYNHVNIGWELLEKWFS